MLKKNSLMREIFQLLVILLPISKNGKEDSIVLRPVVSEDVMTAQFARIDWDLLDPLVESILSLAGIVNANLKITRDKIFAVKNKILRLELQKNSILNKSLNKDLSGQLDLINEEILLKNFDEFIIKMKTFSFIIKGDKVSVPLV